jgi:hypothetical protein
MSALPPGHPFAKKHVEGEKPKYRAPNRKFCDCGNPATVRRISAFICDRCFQIEERNEAARASLAERRKAAKARKAAECSVRFSDWRAVFRAYWKRIGITEPRSMEFGREEYK